MKHLKLFFALFAMLALGVTNAWAQDVIYKLDGTKTGGSSAYADASTITQNDVSWSVVGNTTQNPWRIGGKSLTKVDRTIASTKAISSGVSKIVVTHGTASSITVNSLKLIVASDKNFANVVSTITGTFKASNSTTFECPDGADWTNMFYKLVYNVTVSGSSNKFVQFKSAEFYEAEPQVGDDIIVKTLKSIAVAGMTTTYEQGDIFKFDGTCTATYSVTKNDEPQEVETKGVTPTSVSTPDMNQVGNQTITVSYTEDEVTVTTTYDIEVTANEVTPGTYTGNLNNVFFDCATGNNSAEQSGKFDDVLVVAGCKSTAQTKTNYQSDHVRFYADSYLTLSVPAGYVIKSIVFTAGGTWNGDITASTGTYNNDSKTWTGNAQEVKFSFAQQNRIKSVKITYAADVKYTLNITTPSNGTLEVKDGSAVLADGAQVYDGTKLVVTPTPATGYVFESLTVGGSVVELTDGTYTFNMPATDVTISATFKENEKPAATLTLSKNGVTEDITGYKQDDKVTLPSITSDCVKAFVGWSADANCATEPEYKAGNEYTLVETAQTLYAVYAKVGGGAETTAANTLSSNGWANQSQHKSLQIDENVEAEIIGTSLSNSGKYYTSGTNWRLYQNENPNLIISTTTGELKSIKFTFTAENTGTLLYGSTEITSGTAVEVSGTSATFSVGNSGSATNGQIRISKIEVVYTGGVSYSDYSTTCSTALAAPTFSLAEGTYNEAKSVTITATEGTIYYTLDGQTPDASSTPYSTAIVLDECGEHTIKAIAISTDSESPIASATYKIQLPIPANSDADPYTEAEAIEVYNGGCYDGAELVYVTGTVKTATFYTSGTYTITLTNGFQFYKFYKSASKELFTDGDVNAGDVLVACGKLSKYNTTYQLAEGCYLVSQEKYEGEKTDISNTESTAYTVDQAFALIADVSSDLTKEVYVKGLVAVAPTSNPTTDGQMTYSISDNGEAIGNVLKVYLGLNLNGEAFTSKNDVQLGDYVVVKGMLYDYNGTYELNKGNQLVQHIKAATITISDITMEVDETKTIAATITPATAETAVTYTIKENTANAISLSGNTITALAEGTATITATIATTAEYMGKTVDFTVTVNAKSTKETVVILAQCGGQWYAMTGAYVTGKTNVLAAIPVEYINGTLYNVADADKSSIEWERSMNGNKATFKNNDKYLAGGTSADLTLKTTIFEWDYNGVNYLSGNTTTKRTFLYCANTNNSIYGFKNYAISNIGKVESDGAVCYSLAPEVVAPVYATAEIYTRDVTNDDYGTICLPYGSSNYAGAEFYEISWMEMNGTNPKGIWLDQVNGALTAGKPYIFKATDDKIAVAYEGTAVTSPIAGEAGLTGTFTLIQDLGTSNSSNILEGNYMISGNQFLLCPAGCWLNANRAYIDATIIANHTTKKAEIPGRRRVCLGETSENEATGFENIVAPEGQAVKAIVNGQLIIIRDGVKYNVQGQVIK